MDALGIIIITLVLLVVSFQIYSVVKSKRSVGKPIPFDKIEQNISEKLKDKKALIYFHSPSCHNCKTLSPVVEKLKTKFANILSIDISQDLKSARAFGIMGTPALIFINNNSIESVHLGVKSEEFIITKLSN